MTSHRFIDAILQALGARTDFRDAILGDLTEEFATHATRDGIAAADRWYCREAVRAVPHLLLDWSRRLHARDVGDLARAILVTLLSVGVLAVLTRAVVLAIMPGTSVVSTPLASGAAVAIVLGLGGLGAVTGGYIAAKLYAGAPLVGAIALGAVWSCLNIAGLALTHASVVATYRLGAPIVVVLGTLAGGMLRARRAGPYTPD